MPLIKTISTKFKGLLTRKSFTSNIGFARKKKQNRIKLSKDDDFVDYETGLLILKDTQVATGFDILKYVLSSKQWVLVANENDKDNTIYDFINNMLLNMQTELNEIVKQQITAVLWGYCVHEKIYDVASVGDNFYFLTINSIFPNKIPFIINSYITY